MSGYKASPSRKLQQQKEISELPNPVMLAKTPKINSTWTSNSADNNYKEGAGLKQSEEGDWVCSLLLCMLQVDKLTFPLFLLAAQPRRKLLIYLNSAYGQSIGLFHNRKLVAIRWCELGRVVVDVTNKNCDVYSRTLQGNLMATCIS